MSERNYLSALKDEECVRAFSARLLDLTGVLQMALQRLSGTDKSFANIGYSVLTEVYGLRTRSYMLLNDSGGHTVGSLSFSQYDLLSLFDRITRVVCNANDLGVVRSVVLSVATLAVSLGEGREKSVDFLFKVLCDDISGWEGA